MIAPTRIVVGWVQREVLWRIAAAQSVRPTLGWLCLQVGVDVSRSVRRLIDNGLVSVCARGIYSLTDAGRERLSLPAPSAGQRIVVGRVQREALDLIDQLGMHADLQSLCDRIGVDVTRSVDRLIDNGLVSVCARGIYSLTDAGRVRLRGGS